MSEIVKFVNHGAASITPAIAEKVLRHLPHWKLEFTQIQAPQFPHLPLWAVLAGLATFNVLLLVFGLRQFHGKAVS